MLRDQKGQTRIIEAMITCLILLAGLSAAVNFSHLYAVSETSELQEVGMNVLHVLDNTVIIESILTDQDNWESELRRLMGTLLPPDTFYDLTLFSVITRQEIIQISNMINQSISSAADVATIQYIATVSYPYLKPENQKRDIILIMDKSGSMNEQEPGDENPKMYYAKDAAKAFVDQLNMSLVQVGVVSFSSESTLDIQLSNNSAEIKAAIDALTANGYTNIGDGISTTNDEFLTNGRDDSVWAYILLSDGKTNRPCPHSPSCDPYEGCPHAREYAVNQSDTSIAMSIAAYTIGLGADTRSFDEDLLKQIATKGYYYAPSAEDLANIYAAIARDLVFEVEYDMVLLQLTIIRAG